MDALKRFVELITSTLERTTRRFPIPVLCFTSATALAIYLLHNTPYLNTEYHDLLLRLLTALVLSTLFSIGVALWAEQRDWPLRHAARLEQVSVIACLLILLTSPHLAITTAFLGIAALIGLSVIPYLGSRVDEHIHCNHNTALVVNTIYTAIAAIILGAGLSAAVASFLFLFEIRISPRIYGDIWIMVGGLFAPFYLLANMATPEQNSAAKGFYPRGVAFIVSYILSPLVIAYLLILYAYVVKIILQGELPKGHIVAMVCAFGGIGILTHLFAYPLVERGALLPRWIARYFYQALWIPIGLLWLAIGIRIQQYGITEQRYLAVLLAIWLTFSAAYMTLRTRRSPFVLITALGFLCFAASFGPWGAFSVSRYDQVARLERLMTQHHLLKDGTVVPYDASKPAISFTDRKQISTMIDYLDNSDKLDAIRPWFPRSSAIQNREERSYSRVRDTMQELNLEYISRWDNSDADVYPKSSPDKTSRGVARRHFSVHNPVNFVDQMTTLNITGYDTFLRVPPYYLDSTTTPNPKVLHPGLDVEVKWNSPILSVGYKGGPSLGVDIAGFYAKLEKDGMLTHIPEDKVDALWLDAETDELKVWLIVERIEGYEQDKILTPTQLSFILFMDRK